MVGIWYGKGPGVDRSGDAFKHANLTGVGRHGGVLALAGDDPASKSSTMPSASEIALYDAQMPVLYPADVQDVLALGLAGLALSRYSGLWVGLKVVTNVADELATVWSRRSRRGSSGRRSSTAAALGADAESRRSTRPTTWRWSRSSSRGSSRPPAASR